MGSSLPDIIAYGDCAWLIRYDVSEYSEGVMLAIHALEETFRNNGHWTEVVAGYDSLLVSFDPLSKTPEHALTEIKSTLKSLKVEHKSPRTVQIPVCYGEHFGPDIGQIAQLSGMSVDEIIHAHSSRTYLVCMMGFVPGFVFLSSAQTDLHHPRHPTPRLKVPAGSIGIAGWQTGIYGVESPGGWQIIGRTPLSIFDRLRANPFLLKAGDRVQFVPIESGDFND